MLLFFIVALVSAAPGLFTHARRASSEAAAKAAVAAAAGTAVLGVTSIASIVNGRDLGLFTIVAPLTDGAWLVGSIILAVTLKRAGSVPPAVAIGLPIAWVATIPLATVGGGILSGATTSRWVTCSPTTPASRPRPRARSRPTRSARKPTESKTARAKYRARAVSTSPGCATAARITDPAPAQSRAWGYRQRQCDRRQPRPSALAWVQACEDE